LGHTHWQLNNWEFNWPLNLEENTKVQKTGEAMKKQWVSNSMKMWRCKMQILSMESPWLSCKPETWTKGYSTKLEEQHVQI